MNKHKKFIKDAYDGKLGLEMCQNWKDKILKAYPEFENVSNDGWHVDTRVFAKQWMGYYQSGFLKFCFNSDGDWEEVSNEHTVSNRNHEREATKEEIKSHLIEEAKKRGFKSGICHKITNGNNVIDLRYSKSERMTYDNFSDKLLLNNWSIYEKGEWAEIINTMTKEEAEKKLNCKIID